METEGLSYVRPRLDFVRREIAPLFPSKADLVASYLKDLVVPHKEVDWWGKIIKSGRELGELSGLLPFEQDILSIWFFKRLKKQVYDYRCELGFEPAKDKVESDEEIIIGLIDAVGTVAGHSVMGEENTLLRGWLFGLKEMADGLAKRMISKDFSYDETLEFMREKLRDSISKRQPIEDLVSPILDLRTNLTE